MAFIVIHQIPDRKVHTESGTTLNFRHYKRQFTNRRDADRYAATIRLKSGEAAYITDGRRTLQVLYY